MAALTQLASESGVASAIRLLEAWIESRMEYQGLPGMSLGIVYDQELVWARGFGYADIETKVPATPGTLYRIASNTKLFTSTAILQLRDRGKLQLDDPIQKHLPWFRLQSHHADAPAITVRHLLTHTAGLPREAAFPYWSDFQFPSSEQIRAALPQQQSAYPPETKWKYSNLGLALAGEVVAAVSGEPCEAYIETHILSPLGMDSTRFALTPALRARLATGYGRRMPDGTRQIRPFTEAAGLNAAAGLSSSVEDLARFAALQFREEATGNASVLKGSTLKEMHRVHWLAPDWKSGRGLGFSILRQGERDLVGHGGWVAGYQTSFITSPGEKLAVIALTNADDGQPYPGAPNSVVDKVFQWVTPAINMAVKPAQIPSKAPREWEPYMGKYRDPWQDRQVLMLDGQLTLINPTLPDPALAKLTLHPVGPHTFRTESSSIFGEDGDLVVFELGPDGKVARLKIGENYTYPLNQT